MTRLRRECSNKRLSKGEIGERAAADKQECVMKLAQAHDVSA
jgi:hypothetical protein